MLCVNYSVEEVDFVGNKDRYERCFYGVEGGCVIGVVFLGISSLWVKSWFLLVYYD